MYKDWYCSNSSWAMDLVRPYMGEAFCLHISHFIEKSHCKFMPAQSIVILGEKNKTQNFLFTLPWTRMERGFQGRTPHCSFQGQVHCQLQGVPRKNAQGGSGLGDRERAWSCLPEREIPSEKCAASAEEGEGHAGSWQACTQMPETLPLSPVSGKGKSQSASNTEFS